MSSNQNDRCPLIGSSNDPKPQVISSTDIFGKSSFVYIEHEGQQYILRITRENKLILTK